MDEHEITKRILNRIKEEYNKQIKSEDKITFEEFRTTCLSHLDIASYSQKDLKYYKIGEAGILVCPKCKRNLDKSHLKGDEREKELKQEIEELNKQVKELEKETPHIIYDSLRGKNIVNS